MNHKAPDRKIRRHQTGRGSQRKIFLFDFLLNSESQSTRQEEAATRSGFYLIFYSNLNQKSSDRTSKPEKEFLFYLLLESESQSTRQEGAATGRGFCLISYSNLNHKTRDKKRQSDEEVSVLSF